MRPLLSSFPARELSLWRCVLCLSASCAKKARKEEQNHCWQEVTTHLLWWVIIFTPDTQTEITQRFTWPQEGELQTDEAMTCRARGPHLATSRRCNVRVRPSQRTAVTHGKTCKFWQRSVATLFVSVYGMRFCDLLDWWEGRCGEQREGGGGSGGRRHVNRQDDIVEWLQRDQDRQAQRCGGESKWKTYAPTAWLSLLATWAGSGGRGCQGMWGARGGGGRERERKGGGGGRVIQ